MKTCQMLEQTNCGAMFLLALFILAMFAVFRFDRHTRLLLFKQKRMSHCKKKRGGGEGQTWNCAVLFNHLVSHYVQQQMFFHH